MKNPRGTDAPTLARELTAFLADARRRRGLRAQTLKSYRCDLQAAAVTLSQPLDALTTPAIETFLMSRNEQPGTTNRRIASVRQFFRWAMRQDLCDHNPVDLVESKRTDTVLRHARSVPLMNCERSTLLSLLHRSRTALS